MKFRVLYGCALPAVLVAGMAACTPPTPATNLGFSGTWARTGALGPYRSVISILKDGDRWRFRWKVDSEDGKWKVRCDWEGQCEEFVDDKRIATYTFHVTQGETPDTLTVECERVALREGDSGYRYIDDLVLDPGGKSVTAYTRKLDETTYARESTRKLKFDKVSDAVADPPPGLRS